MSAGIVVLYAALSAAPDVPEMEIGKARGGPFRWSSADGLAFTYVVPKTYDPQKGASLTFILHGSNLTGAWGFANHRAGLFRPDDIVVSPDGTTPNGQGGFNFLGEKKDLERLHALHASLAKAFKVRATYLYGHSQGSFFALHYAGAYPQEVQGVVGHASGVWTWTEQPKEAHHQAILLLHGTQDPVVPYMQSAGGLRSFQERGYPLARLRSLEGWNHFPAEQNSPTPHASLALAWCEAMTASDADRLTAAFTALCTVKEKEQHDHAGVNTAARRIAALPAAPAALRKRAAAALKTTDDLIARHAAALRKAVAKNPERQFEGKAWIGHVAIFLRAFAGTPGRDELAKEWKEVLDRHAKDAVESLKKHYAAAREGKEDEAFAAGILAIRTGFLHPECEDREFLARLRDWRKRAAELEIPAAAQKDFDALVPAYEKALADGRRAFGEITRAVAKL